MGKQVLIVADYTQSETYTLSELSQITGLPEELILELIARDTIRAEQEQFNQEQLKRLHKAKRLYHDLEVNMAGIALALQLMDELDALRKKLAVLDKHLLK